MRGSATFMTVASRISISWTVTMMASAGPVLLRGSAASGPGRERGSNSDAAEGAGGASTGGASTGGTSTGGTCTVGTDTVGESSVRWDTGAPVAQKRKWRYSPLRTESHYTE